MFETAEFIPRSCCAVDGTWPVAWMWAYITGDLAIALAYFTIPVVLWRTYGQSPQLRLAWGPMGALSAMFGAFIFFCGMGHIWDALTFVWPAYKFFAIWHWCTAVVSWATFLSLAYIAHTHTLFDWMTRGQP